MFFKFLRYFSKIKDYLFKKIYFIYLFMRDTQIGRDTGRGRSRLHAGSPKQDSVRVSRIRPWAEGGAKPLSLLGSPKKIYFIYLFMRDPERGRDTGRGRSRLHAGSPMWDLILGVQDQALG